MTSMSLTELITNQFYEVCNYSDYNVFSQFIKSLSVPAKSKPIAEVTSVSFD